ncbi:restriction endonuclease subunit S [uncultured Prevotella sp.]|uniref:restriction endonuclease subunit S n=1 Tax=uncultured Prevotella sp. TaxID=159272 RepID=UPI002612C285|nr:restriction endonuclease subunit S [uncultured Prevotella sp.]
MNTKALRQKILDLAIHGKLVPQDPNDEPASVLLERIRDEKERLIKEGKIKRPKKSKTTSDKPHYENVPFEVPNSWVWTTLGEIFTLQAGKNITAKDIYTEKSEEYKYPCFGGNGIRGYVAISNKIGEYPIIGRQGALCGNINLAHGSFYATEHAVVVERYCDTDLMWGYYTLIALNLNQYATATAQPGLAVNVINDVAIPLPPLHEQQRISKSIKILFSFLDVIECEKLYLKTAISQTKTKVLDLAIHGKLVPQDPTDEPASKLLKRINPKAEITCDNGHYQKLPEGWCLCELSSLCNIKGGKRIPRGRTFSKERTPHIYIRVSDMKNNTIITTDLKYIDDDVYQTIKNYTISSSDLYLTIAGTIGHVGIVPKQFDGMNLTENAAKLTGIICDKKYLLYSLLSSTAQEHFKSRFHQVAQPKLSIETASSTMIYLPPLKEQHRIVAKIEEIFAQLDAIETSL